MGILITEIDPEGCAADSALKVGDSVLSIDSVVPMSPKHAVQLMPSGYYTFRLQFVDVSFNAKYINPLWICSPESERQQVLDLVAIAVNRTPWDPDM